VKKYVDHLLNSTKSLFVRAGKTTLTGARLARVEAIEPRLLYSADLAPLVLLDANSASPSPTYLTQSAPAAPETIQTTELVVIDSKVEAIGQLLADIQTQQDGGRQITLLLVGPEEDGIASISETLAELQNQGLQVSAIHLLSHGDDGQFELGKQIVDNSTLRQSTAAFSAWSMALSANADILIYGCNLTGSENGRIFAKNLSAITGADVAGNSDQTGQLLLGGDWTLDTSTGPIEAMAALTAKTQLDWNHLLALGVQGLPSIVNTTTVGSQSTGSDVLDIQADAESTGGNKVAVDGAGNYVIAWIDGGLAKIRFFNADGTPRSSEQAIANLPTPGSTQHQIAVAMNASGDVVVSWVAKSDGFTDVLYAQRFYADGTISGQILVTGDADATKPAVALSDSGDFVITWQQADPTKGIEIKARVFTPLMQPLTTVITLNLDDAGDQIRPAISMRGDTAAIVWHDTNDNSIVLRTLKIYTSNVYLSTSEVTLNSAIASTARGAPDVAINANNSIVVAWHAAVASTLHTYKSTLLVGSNIGDTPVVVSPQSRVNSSTSAAQSLPKVAIADNGNFVILQQISNQAPDSSGWGIFARMFTINGAALSPTETPVNFVAGDSAFSTLNQSAPAIAWRSETQNIVTAWSSDESIDQNVLQRQVSPYAEQIFIVNTVTDSVNASDGLLSLREALTAANLTPNQNGVPDKIHFNIPGLGPSYVINIPSTLPAIEEAVDISGSTQQAFNGGTITIIDSSASSSTFLLQRNLLGGQDSSGSSITGLRITSANGKAIIVNSDNNTIARNVLFNSAAGGIEINGNSVLNQGSNRVEDNEITSNLGDGITINNGRDNFVVNNRIYRNTGTGISIVAPGVFFGSTNNSISQNTIAENAHGIDIQGIDASENKVIGNWIGGGSPSNFWGNLGSGIRIFGGATENTIGGTAPIMSNTIAENGGFGVEIDNSLDNAASLNSILRNSIYLNNSAGISVDSYEAITAPYLNSAFQGGINTIVYGLQQGLPNSYYRIEFFATQGATPSSTTSGRFYLGFINVTTNASGRVSFKADTLSPIPAGFSITATATATDATFTNFSSTSNFSNSRSAGAQIIITEGTNPIISLAQNTRFGPPGAISYSLNNTTDAAGFSLSPLGTLSLNSPVNYEALIADVAGGNDNILWLYVSVYQDGVGETVIHQITVLDANDAPVINIAPPITTLQGNTVSFTGANTISVADPDTGPIALATELTLTIEANVAGALDYSGQLLFGGLNGPLVQKNGTLAQLNAYLANLTYIPDSNETRSIQLRFTLSDGGSGFGGAPLERYASQDISITPTSNIAPVITGVPAYFTYSEDSGPIALFSTASITHLDDLNLQSMAISYTPLLNLFEESFTLPDSTALGGLSLVHDTATGLITITGQARTEVYENLLRSITYQNTANAPTTQSRSFTVFVNDGQDLSNFVPVEVVTEYRNDAPTISLSNLSALGINFGASFNFSSYIVPYLSFGDPDSSSASLSYSLDIILSLASEPGVLSFSASAMTALTDTGLTVTGNPSGSSLVNFTGAKSLIEQAINLLVYSSANGHVGAEAITFFLSDLGNIGIGGALTAQTGISVITNPMANSAPVISGINPAQIYTEGSAPIPIFNGINITDSQQTNLTQAKITVSGDFDPTQDSFPRFLSILGGIDSFRSGNVTTLSGDFPIANYVAALESLSFSNFSNSPSGGARIFTVEVFDGISWSTAVSTSVLVDAVDNPTELRLPNSRTVNFGQTLNLSGLPGELYLIDLDAGLAKFEMVISTLHGRVFVGSSTGGSEVRVQGTIAALNDYLQQQVSYNPNNGFSGTDKLIVEISQYDVSTAQAFGVPIASGQMDINVLAGISPEIIDASPKADFAENSGGVMLHPSLQIIGGNTGFINSATIQITQGYERDFDSFEVGKLSSGMTTNWDLNDGILTISGQATIFEYTLALASISFNNSSENPSDAPRIIKMSVSDSLQTSTDVTIEVSMLVSNDSPTISSPTQILSSEDTTISFSLANAITVGDPDSNELVLTLLTTSGTVSWTGAPGPVAGVRNLSPDQIELSGSASEITRLASFIQVSPAENFNGVAQIQWSLIDNQGASSNAATAIQIAPVNDAPTWQTRTGLGVNQGQTAIISTSQSSATDIEDAAAQLTYELSTLPTHGELLMNGTTVTLASLFTQSDIDSGRVTYKHNGSTNASDAFTFAVKDSAGARTTVSTVAITIATTPVIVISPTSTGNGSGGAGSNGTGGNNAVPPQVVPVGITVANDTKSISTTAATAGVEAPTQAVSPATTTNSVTSKPATRSVPSGTFGSSSTESGQLTLGNSAGFFNSEQRLIDTAGTAINQAQQNSRMYASQELSRSDQGVSAGLIRNRTATENNEYADIIRTTLNTQAFADDLQKVRDEATKSLKLDQNVVASTTAVSATLSIGYVIWLVRGGALLSSLLASMPAWRMIDPLPILDSMGGGDDDNADDDSLDAMIEKSKANRINEKEVALAAT
jgi:hypothetical protein